MSGAAVLLAGSKLMPSFGAIGATASPGAASINVPYPTGIAAGTPLFCFVLGEGTGAAVNVPGGWTEIGSGSLIGSGATACQARVFWLSATGSESGSLTVTGTGTMRGFMWRASNGLSIESGSITGNATGASSISAVNVTTTGSSELACQIMVYKSTNTIANITGESGTDYTEPTAEINDGTYSFDVQTGQVGSATAITGGSATLGAACANRFAAGWAIVP